ncbi:MAG: hypothetical protein HOC71_07290, partial [Candidatus Latescibacteria bacterium]|nr:hypothetical protein [Candidatus Latescibacterota bacterium]
MRNLLIILFVIVLFAISIVQSADGDAVQREHVFILVDLSDSALHVNNELFARKAAQYIGSII